MFDIPFFRKLEARLSSFHRVPNNSNGRGLCHPADPLDSIPRAFWQSWIILEYSLSLATRLRNSGKIPAEPAGYGGYVTHLFRMLPIFSPRPVKTETSQTTVKTRKMKRKRKIVSYVWHRCVSCFKFVVNLTRSSSSSPNFLSSYRSPVVCYH